MNPEEWNEKLSEAISIVKSMGLRVVSIDAASVVVRIPIAPNMNDKGTLFAGSSYSALVLAGWTLAMAKAAASGFERPWAAIVDAHVYYARPITEDMEAVAVFAETPHLAPDARNWAKIRVTAGEKLAFEGTYAVGVKK